MKVFLQNIEFYLIALVAFAIPLEKRMLPYIIAVYVIQFLFHGNLRQKLGRIFKSRYVWITTAYYAFLILGCLYSEEKEAAYFDLQVKLSMLIFPIMLSGSDLTKKQFMLTLVWYIVGCMIAFLICLSYALLFFHFTNDVSLFFYNKLSVFHHTTYFSMYLNFAILILYYYLIFDNEYFVVKKIFWLIFLIVIFSLFVVLLSSKIGLIALLLIIFVGTVFWFLRSLAVFPSIIVFTMLTSMIYVSFKYSSTIQGRIQEAFVNLTLETPSQSTTGARLIIWDIAYDMILSKPILGFGTGDVKAELVKRYKEFEYEHLYEVKLNAHNQYVQTLIAIGILGSLFFWAYMYSGLLRKNTVKNFMYLGFMVLLSLNFLTESMLETQAGVVFYAFFNAILYTNRDKVLPLKFR